MQETTLALLTPAKGFSSLAAVKMWVVFCVRNSNGVGALWVSVLQTRLDIITWGCFVFGEVVSIDFSLQQHSSLWINSVWYLFGLILHTLHLTFATYSLSKKMAAKKREVKHCKQNVSQIHFTTIRPSRHREKQREAGTLSSWENSDKERRF